MKFPPKDNEALSVPQMIYLLQNRGTVICNSEKNRRILYIWLHQQRIIYKKEDVYEGPTRKTHKYDHEWNVHRIAGAVYNRRITSADVKERALYLDIDVNDISMIPYYELFDYVNSNKRPEFHTIKGKVSKICCSSAPYHSNNIEFSYFNQCMVHKYVKRIIIVGYILQLKLHQMKKERNTRFRFK